MLDWLIGDSDTYMPLLALMVFIALGKRVYKKESLLLIYLIVNIIVFGTSNILGSYKINNLYLYHFYTLIELVTVSYYITKKVLKKNLRVFYIISICFFVFWIINIIFWEPLSEFNSNSAVLASLIILLLTMYYMLELSKSEDILYFQKLPGFWIASAFLVSCAISILSLVAYKYFQQNNLVEEGIRVWIIESIGNILKFILLIIGLLCYRRPPSTQSILSL